MGFRFRKSFKVAPGVRVNVGKTGVGFSVGGKGLRVNKSSRGTTLSAGIPGTGISYQKRISSPSKSKSTTKTNYQKIQREKQERKEIQTAAELVQMYDSLIDSLTTVHENISDPIDWEKISTSTPPFDVENEDGPNVKELKRQIDEFKTTWRDRFFNRVEARKRDLYEQMDKAIEEDKVIYNTWETERNTAQKVLNDNLKTWSAVIARVNPFEDIKNLGSSITFKFISPKKVIAKLDIHNRSVVPTTVLSLTKTGKLSERNMAKGKYLQLYQDYVCSCALRIARDFFNILPVGEVIVNVYDEAPAESVEEYGCILSVSFPREQIESINFYNIDCSDTIEQFQHNMKFLKTKGFKFVEELEK